jgi:hypothetical protein
MGTDKHLNSYIKYLVIEVLRLGHRILVLQIWTQCLLKCGCGVSDATFIIKYEHKFFSYENRIETWINNEKFYTKGHKLIRVKLLALTSARGKLQFTIITRCMKWFRCCLNISMFALKLNHCPWWYVKLLLSYWLEHYVMTFHNFFRYYTWIWKINDHKILSSTEIYI